MTKELFVSSTPHETKVGLVEDDLLAEIYLERENEYTLAGSIYKGRVTRVLPGMQSAFVDIGLERDAFLYVSDFMELEEHDEDVTDVVPMNRGVSDLRQQPHESQTLSSAETSPASEVPASSEGPSFVIESEPFDGEEVTSVESEAQPARENAPTHQPNDDREERGGYRGRRRRRGRRGERGGSESRYTRPAAEEQTPAASPHSERPAPALRAERAARSEYGPPPGYQPIILPGESISKYQRLQNQRPTQAATPAAVNTEETSPEPVAKSFPDDEPIFANSQNVAEASDSRRDQAFDVVEQSTSAPELVTVEAPVHEPASSLTRDDEVEQEHEPEEGQRAEVRAQAHTAPFTRDRDRYEDMNVASVFGGTAATAESEQQNSEENFPEADRHIAAIRYEPESTETPVVAATGTMEEEEIEEEEADVASYVEELEEDAHFEELEEETQEVNGVSSEHGTRDIAASGETAVESFPTDGSAGTEEVSEQETEEDTEDSELEEAQAEAEALLAAESQGQAANGDSATVEAPATAAHPYPQRGPRRFDRRGRGGHRPGGRRFSRRPNTPHQPTPLISDLLKEGQEILVQIAKEPIGKKGARITSHIALPGRFLVYMPTVNHTGVSRKIASDEERMRLKRIVMSERENGQGGFIVRTAAQGAAEEELRADIRFLKNLWNEIKTRAENGKAPALIYHDLNVVERVLRDQVTSDFSQIWVDNEQEYERILRFANRFQPALVRRVKLYSKETPLFEQFGLTDEINKALKSKVWLKSGGYIVINQTEALVAIDINTGKYVGKTARLEDTIVKTNVDAIREIVRQIRLRDLGGIIVIDFIDMDERRNRQKVMQALEEALRADRAPSKVLQFNDFGLVAITRKRVKQSLERTIGTPCPYCTATGYVKSVTTVCNEIYVEMRKIAKHLDHSDVMLRVNPEVGKVLKINNGRWLTEMEELTGKSIIVKNDPALHQEQFDIN